MFSKEEIRKTSDPANRGSSNDPLVISTDSNFACWIKRDLARLESEFEQFVTKNSLREDFRSGR